MIISRNNSHGGIIRVCIGIFTTAVHKKSFFNARGKPRNGQLAKMGSFHQSKRSDNR